MTRTDSGGGVAIEMRSVSKIFGSNPPAVDNLSLTVPAGKFVTLLGPSGSGKTTTLMMLAGFVEPDKGEVVINGTSMKGVPAHRRAIGVMFQHYALFPHMTVGENIAYPLKARRVDGAEIHKRTAEVLDLIQLPEVANRYPAHLSGGQQQRIALARALVFKPGLLLMDEPLGALDRKLREQMQIELRTLQQKLGITTITVTHDQEEAMAMSDEVVVMRDGRIEQQGTAQHMYERPKTAFIADFLGTSNLIEGHGSQNAGGHFVFRTDGGLAIPGVLSDDAPAKPTRLMIRPERIRWPQDEPTDVCLTCKIDAVVYLGERTRFRMVLPDGQAIIATLLNRSGPQAHRAGDDVEIGWKHEDVVYL